MEKTKTDNELIAEFVGFIPRQSTRYGRMWKHPYLAGEFGETHGMKFLYHSSWNALMPVVDKIVKLFDEAFPPGEDFAELILAHKEPIEKEYMDVVGLPIGTPIQEVYQAVVTFIKWHNEK